MATSIDSERPILAPSGGNHSSVRLSTYSKATSESSSAFVTYDSSNPDSDLKEYRAQVKRMEAEAMEKQRYQLSQKKLDEQSKLALCRKVEKSLERRYHNQDAVMKPKRTAISEKQ